MGNILHMCKLSVYFRFYKVDALKKNKTKKHNKYTQKRKNILVCYNLPLYDIMKYFQFSLYIKKNLQQYD